VSAGKTSQPPAFRGLSPGQKTPPASLEQTFSRDSAAYLPRVLPAAKPSWLSLRAGVSSSAHGMEPSLECSRARPLSVPGTPTAVPNVWRVANGMGFFALSKNMRGRALFGASSLASITNTFLVFAS